MQDDEGTIHRILQKPEHGDSNVTGGELAAAMQRSATATIVKVARGIAPVHVPVVPTMEEQSSSTAGRLIDVLLLGFYCFVIRGFTLLDITPGEKSVMILVPSLCKQEFVGLG